MTAKDNEVSVEKANSVAVDWMSIELQYRTGVPSIRALADVHGVSEAAIRKRAKKYNWQRDLASKVRERAHQMLCGTPMSLSSASKGANEGPSSDVELQMIEPADTVVQVIREHRKFAARSRELLNTLYEELEFVSNNQAQIEQTIAEVCKDEKMAPRKEAMLKAVSLQSQIAMLKSLNDALSKVIYIERQSFNLTNEGSVPTKTDSDDGAKKFVFEPLKAPDFLSKRRKFDE